MRKHWAMAIGGGLIAAICVGDASHAQDFFSQFFGGPPRRSERLERRLPFAPEFLDDDDRQNDGRSFRRRSPLRAGGGSGQAFCVRTCDGRYFPISTQGEQSKAASCSNFCPSSETRVYTGSTIDNAYAEGGKRYGDLPNAFKYRNELVAGCTCNGKDATGLAPIKLEDDPTLKRGDIVSGEDGLLVNRGSDRRGAMNFSPVSASVRAIDIRARSFED